MPSALLSALLPLLSLSMLHLLLLMLRRLLLLRRLLWITATPAASRLDLADRQSQLATCEVYLGDDHLCHIADADLHPRPLAAHDAGLVIDIPPIVHQIFVTNQ